MLNIAIRLFGVLLLLALIVVGIGYVLPREYSIKASIEVNADPAEVFALVNSLPNWQRWSTWNEERVEDLTIEYGDQTSGVGAVQTWRDSRGSGKLWVTASEENRRLEYRLKFGEFPEMCSEIELAPTKTGVLVNWVSSGSLPNGPFYGYSALFFPTQMQHQYQTSLERLKFVLEE